MCIRDRFRCGPGFTPIVVASLVRVDNGIMCVTTSLAVAVAMAVAVAVWQPTTSHKQQLTLNAELKNAKTEIGNRDSEFRIRTSELVLNTQTQRASSENVSLSAVPPKRTGTSQRYTGCKWKRRVA